MAIDRKTGRTIWEQVAAQQEPHEAGHFENSTWASGSATTDGQAVFAYFESFGLYAYDMSGKLLWQKDLGDKHSRLARAGVLHGPRREHAGDPFRADLRGAGEEHSGRRL